MSFWAAWQFLTTLPSPCRRGHDLTGLGRAAGFFPVVGLVLGLVLFGLDRLLGLLLPAVLVNILLVIAIIVLTGALHLDGLIDTCDGLAVKSSAADRLMIMTDARVGGFGVVGGCCLILLKFVSLAALPSGLRSAALLLTPVLSRWGMVYAISAFPAARKEGIGWAVKQGVDRPGIALATLVALVVAMLLLGWWGAALVGATWLVVLAVSRYLCSLLGGLSGDSYGAVNELGEVAVLILASAMGRLGIAAWLGPLLR
ncbi:MAG: adenosylcobinamide-GDP ribazoletransferase [Chloroflexota bacterium]